jgi:hypothetical protein
MNNGEPELTCVPAENSDVVKNCVVIPDGVVPTVIDVVVAAIKGKAFFENKSNTDNDCYMIQFPGYEQELLSEDDFLTRLSELMETI